MITRYQQSLIIEKFNAFCHGRNKRDSAAMNELFDSINEKAAEATDADVLEYIKANANGRTKVLDILDAYSFSRWMRQRDSETATEEKEQPMPKTEPVGATAALGVLEKVLHDSVVNGATEEVTEAVKPIIDDFIKATYGPQVRSVRFEFPDYGTSGDGVYHEEFLTVLAYAAADEPVLLTGPAGTGKNIICQQTAEAMGLEFYFSNAVTQEYKLTGFTDANGVFHESQFYKAFTEGGVFMLDEMDASIPEVLITLNAAIANRYFDFPAPIGKKEAHPDFRVIAAANTFGTGADSTYSGRYQLDGASLDRFAVVEISYSKAIEESMTNDQELLDFIRAFRAATTAAGVPCIVSYRAIKRLDKMSQALTKQKALRTGLLKGLETADLRMISKDDLPAENSWTKAFIKEQTGA